MEQQSNSLVYSLISQTDKVSIKPYEIGNNIKNSVKKYLVNTYENNILQSGIYIIKVIDINTDCIANGVVNDLNGDICYDIEYSAYVFDPVVGGIFDIIINKCNELGIWGYPTLCGEKSFIECISSNELISNKVFKDGNYVRNDRTSCSQEAGTAGPSVVSKGAKGTVKSVKDKNKKGSDNETIGINSVVKFKVLNRQIENNKITIFGIIL